MRNATLALLLAVLAATTTTAAVIVYTDRPSFNAAAPAGLTIENFENGTLASGAVVGIPGTLDATSSNAVFAPGAIAPGIRFDISQSIFVGNGDRHFPTIYIMNNAEGDPTTITFPLITVTALAFDFFGTFFENGPAVLTLYDTSNNVLWSDTYAPPGTGIFIGLISDTPIGRLTSNNGIAWYGFDNIAFGAGAEVPEPSSYLITGLGIGLIGLTLGRRSLKP